MKKRVTVSKIVLGYGLMYEKTWVNMVRFTEEGHIQNFLRMLKYGIGIKNFSDEDERYIVHKASEVAFYVLSESGNPKFEKAVFELALMLIREEAAKGEAYENTRFVGDVLLWCVLQKRDAMLSAVVKIIRKKNPLVVVVLNSVIYGLYDGDISESNVHIVKKLVYHLRSPRVIQEFQTELYEVFTILDKEESILDDYMARELFADFSRVKPIFYTKLPEGDQSDEKQ